jgi:hypothetical protein
MAQKPTDKKHGAQILAGTVGRNKGHSFEKHLAEKINAFDLNDKNLYVAEENHIFTGDPAFLLLRYVLAKLGIKKLSKVQAWWLGGLATSGEGDELLDEEGQIVSKSKSDILLKLWTSKEEVVSIGVSVKTCNKSTPTNDQLYFTTASAFTGLLRRNGLEVSEKAEHALKMFCGDSGFRPVDAKDFDAAQRQTDPDRWFWEELPKAGRGEWERLFSEKQNEISKILLQKAYLSDPFAPEFLLHQTVATSNLDDMEVALFRIDELIKHSSLVGGFSTRPYKIRKGRFKNDPAEHLAPRFGFIQMQRGGQKQHPTQLQFNLQAGYFYKLKRIEQTS